MPIFLQQVHCRMEPVQTSMLKYYYGLVKSGGINLLKGKVVF